MSEALDLQLLHALHVDGRAPFSLIADVLGVSDQTVARRYSRLYETGMLRVRGLTDPAMLEETRWIVRVQCTPSAAAATAAALARREDTSWISLTSGGTEIVCAVRSGHDDNRLLLDTLPRSRQVVAMSAHCVLHEFFGDHLALVGKVGPLSDAQVRRLLPTPDPDPAPAPAEPTRRAVSLRASDRRMLELLQHDGRATVAELAASSGASQSTVRRRMAELRSAGVLYFDVDFQQSLLDLHVRAMLWLSVAPDRLEQTGEALAAHRETGFVAAMTGSASLCMSALCRDTPALYRYLTTSIAALPAIEHVEVVPVLRTVKRTGVLERP